MNRLASTKEIINLRDYGWDMEKAEGLTLLPDHQTIAVVNDNDFGVATSTDNGQAITDLTYDPETKKWMLNHLETPTTPIFSINAVNERKSSLWFVTIPELTTLLKK